MLTWIAAVLMTALFVSGITGMTSVPAPVTAQHGPDMVETGVSAADIEQEWQEFNSLAYSEYSDEFTRIYDALEVRWSKNGRLMMRSGDSGPYRFVKRNG
jgi:hypothetical protein